MLPGMAPDRPFPPRRYLSLRSLPRSVGMEPVRFVFERSSTERKERLPRWGVSSPCRGTSGIDRAITRCKRLLHKTPLQLQKDTLVVQLPARTPRGSESRPLKASSAARSVSLT
ncbi:hypothetical protein PVAP13_6KG295406 [Panicum virgatum]|uniref:Uncharacterized protein n=1 Tax=Panicum virgatum TaxID=38727 RepID=A0A8T0RGY6_PANVG|nr:hypothetical protein PVAP13_6KG295406 [Panicum virgatum]